MKKFIFLIVLLFAIICYWPLEYLRNAEDKASEINFEKIVIKKKADDFYERVKHASWFCVASWYGKKHHGKKMADGKIYDMYQISVAHKDLPIGTLLKITSTENRKSILARVRDRGPYIAGREIDLSYKAAKKLGALKQGLILVKIVRLS